MKPSAVLRWRVAFALLAWLAQALLPVAHATVMGAPHAAHGVWCGSPAGAQVALAMLPAEVRSALDDGAVNADQLAACTLLCALGSMAAPADAMSPAMAVRFAGLEATPADPVLPPGRPQSPTPPCRAPPRA